ncbi:MAG: hypothetical protein ABI950_00325 [Solirubrobacteraceae bacterium]
MLAVPRPVRWSRRRRRVGLGVVLLAAALVSSSSLAVLGIFAAFVLVLDVLIPVPCGTWSEADDHFARLQRRRRLGRAGALELLDDGAGWERRDRGTQEIAVGSIAGTVEAEKTRAFDGAFRPARGEAEHWKRLWLAHAHGAALPPITVYRVGERHFVRDGHHRVSVAIDLDCSTIDAEVVELVPQRRSVANSAIA